MKSKKNNFIMLLALLTAIFFYSCKEDDIDEVALNSIELSNTDIQLSIGEIQAIIVSGEPDNANELVTWSSDNETVVEIQYNDLGLVVGVKGLSLGTATLTATTSNGSISKTVNVEVIVKVESIVLEEEEIPGLTQTKYNVIFTPENATIKDITWESSDPSVISVANGIVTAVSAGSAVITATSVQGGKTASVSLVASGDPAILGLQYCSIIGSGSYNADTITTTGADANLNHASGQPANNYGYYENEVLIVQPGASFDLSLVQSNNWSMSLIYIDWNGDKDFIDDGELVSQFGLPEQLNNGPFSTNIAVPLDAAVGKVRMRVLTGDAWTTDLAGVPCGEYANSTTKDFDIEIGGVAYCDVTGAGAYNADGITTTGGSTNIDYDGTGVGVGYLFVPQTVTVEAGGAFNLSVLNSNGWTRSIVWVDFNGDGDFLDDGELIGPLSAEKYYSGDPGEVYNIDVDVPSDAATGSLRIRVLTGDAWVYNDDMSGNDPDGPGIPVSPCGDFVNGTWKDFTLEVI